MTKFPPARIMVNPIITAVSEETQCFNHGCLSVPCANRCSVESPMAISVTYQDPQDEMKNKEATLTGTDAVVLWHELTHIVFGKTYMDVTFELLPQEDLEQFIELLKLELKDRQSKHEKIPELSVPPFHLSFTLNEKGIPRLDLDALMNVLSNSSEETLMGLCHQAECVLKKNRITSDEPLNTLFNASFFKSQRQNPISSMPIGRYCSLRTCLHSR